MTSTIKVNTIQDSCGSSLVAKCGANITLGASGKTVRIACGASTVGMGRTGTVDWCTTAKTSPFTGVSGKGYFINTTSGAVTVTLPSSPSAGDILAFSDYANQWATNNVTVCRNSSAINGGAYNTILNTNGSAVTLIYVDGTRGWKQVNDATENITGAPNFISASGGTITTSGDFKIHTFTSDGNFVINTAPTPGNNNVSYMVVAGGGAGGVTSVSGGGGGAGGFREGETPAVPYTGSPLKNSSGLPIAAGTYPISVGAGGASASPPYTCGQGNSGSNSIFSTITSAGGGGGGGYTPGAPGGSGGGGAGANAPVQPGGTGNSPPVSPPQGSNGGAGGNNPSSYANMGGGGGATAVGESISGNHNGGGPGGNGGTGATSEITGSPVAYAGGGGGAADNRSSTKTGGDAGTGGGGTGGDHTRASTSGTANTGGGGGGQHGPSQPSYQGANGAGGSGIVVIRYKFQ